MADLVVVKPTVTSPLDRFNRHQVELERIQLSVASTDPSSVDRNMNFVPRGGARGRGGRGGRGGGGAAPSEAAAFSEQILRGVVTKVDYALRKGEVTSKDTGAVQFFLEQTEYGLRKINKDDTVAFRLDTYRPRPAAIELRPIAPTEAIPTAMSAKPTTPITGEDLHFFISECAAANVPIYQIRRVLLARDDWAPFMNTALRLDKQNDIAIAILKITNCAENIINPIHRPVLRCFFELMCDRVTLQQPLSNNGTTTTTLFPNIINSMVTTMIPTSATTAEGASPVPSIVFGAGSHESEKAVLGWIDALEKSINIALEVSELLTLLDQMFISSGEGVSADGGSSAAVDSNDVADVAANLANWATHAESASKMLNADVDAAFRRAEDPSDTSSTLPRKNKSQLQVNILATKRLKAIRTRALAALRAARNAISTTPSSAVVVAEEDITSVTKDTDGCDTLLPTCVEMSFPTWDPRSAFNPINLAVADVAVFDSSVQRGAEALVDMLHSTSELPQDGQLADYRLLSALLDVGSCDVEDSGAGALLSGDALLALQTKVTQLTNSLHHTLDDERAYITAHCKLLRADTFTNFVNVVGRVVFPGIKAFRTLDERGIKKALTAEQKAIAATADFPSVRFEPKALQTSLDEATENAKHHRFYTNIQFEGKLLSRDFEYSRVNTYLFSFEEADPAMNGREKPIRWDQVLQKGTLVLLSCSETTNEVKELFWGTVSSVDDGAMCRKMVAVHPVAGSDFERGLLPLLERNKRNGTNTTRSIMVESNAFFTGFESVMKGLRSFRGTDRTRLPFGEILLAPRPHSSSFSNNADDTEEGGDGASTAADTPEEKALKARKQLMNTCLQYIAGRKAVVATRGNDLLLKNIGGGPASTTATKKKKGALSVRAISSQPTPPSTWHIPQFAAAAFSQLLFNTRVQCRFDRGQDRAMKHLGGRQVLLVQGPPGTGKSFIGCRVVETYVRYKQMLSSGSIISAIDTDYLPSTDLTTIAPSLFASGAAGGEGGATASPAANNTAAPSPSSSPSAYIGPIVVITYKNHALDEFLVDLRRSGLWSPERTRFESSADGAAGTSTMYPRGCKLVRIGSRSGEEELEQYNLNNLVATSGVARSKVAPFRERIGVLARRCEKLASEVGVYLENGSVPAKLFTSWLTPDQARSMRYEDLDKWLDGSDLIKNHDDPTDDNSADITKDYYLQFIKSHLQTLLATKTPPLPVYAHDAVLPKTKEALAAAAAEVAAKLKADGVVDDEEDAEAIAAAAALIDQGRGAVASAAGAENDDDVRGTVFGAMQRELAADDRDNNGDAGGKKKRSGNDEDVPCRFNPVMSAESLKLILMGVGSDPATSVLPLPEGLPASAPTVSTLFSLPLRHRHLYFAYLLQGCIKKRAVEFVNIQKQIQNLVALRNHAQDEAKLQLLQQADVIGLTTTGCAMNQTLLRALRPRVLVVEEAAEVLESQLLACMTDNLAQIVLIGDHYQLKPRVETFALERHNNMNTSLFERLSSVISPILLVEQRRMRPGISRLVRPFYNRGAGIVDHECVVSRPFIDAAGNKHKKGALGLQHDAFLWTHSHPEQTAAAGLSKVNMQEIAMVHLAVSHLLTQGVSPSSITVITPYLGQRRAIQGSFMGAAIRGARGEGYNTGGGLPPPSPGVLNSMSAVRVSTVDMFQGDENDIIILSLVRTERLTDFMKMRNRMIVACSRARFAMVVVGCEGLLRQAEHWSQVVDILSDDNLVGDGLPITTTTTTSSASPDAIAGKLSTTTNLLLYADGTTVEQKGSVADNMSSSVGADVTMGGGGLLAMAMRNSQYQVDKKRRTEEGE